VQGYEDKGQLGAALAIIRHARRHAPRDRALVADVLRLARRAVDEARAEGRPRDALETVDGALEALPDGVRDHRDITASLRYLRGCTLGTLDQLADAEKDLAESVRLAPDSEPYREQLEVVRRALRGTGRALERRAGRKAKVSRNSPCPCGSGRKYKRCCGR
jgi:tetratricopeptide (TPR) repeat protein